MKVYLAGAIDHVTPEFACGWRKQARTKLRAAGFEIGDPTEGKDLYAYQAGKKIYTKTQAGEEIVMPDMVKINDSDIILAEMSRDDIPYHGTSMELVYGHLLSKIVIVWGGCRAAWVIYHSEEIMESLDEAIDYIIRWWGNKRS